MRIDRWMDNVLQLQDRRFDNWMIFNNAWISQISNVLEYPITICGYLLWNLKLSCLKIVGLA